MEQKTAPTTGKYGKQRTGRWESHQTAVREASEWIVCRVTENEELYPVEGSAPSEDEKEFAYEAGAGNVEVPASTA
jgi:hypothetical protein